MASELIFHDLQLKYSTLVKSSGRESCLSISIPDAVVFRAWGPNLQAQDLSGIH